MSTPFLGQIDVAGFNFTPRGYAACDGSLLAISENDALFALIGTTYGGDGQNTFAMPNLSGRSYLNQGQGPGLSNRSIGEAAGNENVTLVSAQLPLHSHNVSHVVNSPCHNGAGNGDSPVNAFYSSAANPEAYATASTDNMAPNPYATTVEPAGGNQPHDNLPPFLCLNFIIATEGIFPSRS